jgi:beta-N-acetylhexosaminidase
VPSDEQDHARRHTGGVVLLRLASSDRILAVMPRLEDLVTVALRTPWDLAAYPVATTHLCTYSILPASLEALARVVVGRGGARGRLPVPLGTLHPVGHGA